MRWVTYRSPSDDLERVGVLESDDRVHGSLELSALVDLIGDGDEALTSTAERILSDPLEVLDLTSARLTAPIPRPPSIRDFMAFEEHVVTSMGAIGQQVDPAWYELPVFYFTNPSAVLGPHDDVAISPGSTAFDYELEVAAVVGRPGRDLRPEDAWQHIAGWTILCDWSARDLQAHEMRVGLGPAKGKDSATSLGPWLATADEVGDLDLAMTASVNQRPCSAGRLSDLYWSFAQMLAYASRGTTLVTGDIIASGTVGTGCLLELSRVHGEDAYPWLLPGDRVRLEVERLGTIEVRVTPAAPLVSLGPPRRPGRSP